MAGAVQQQVESHRYSIPLIQKREQASMHKQALRDQGRLKASAMFPLFIYSLLSHRFQRELFLMLNTRPSFTIFCLRVFEVAYKCRC